MNINHRKDSRIGRYFSYLLLILAGAAAALFIMKAFSLANSSYEPAHRSDDVDYQLQRLEARQEVQASTTPASSSQNSETR